MKSSDTHISPEVLADFAEGRSLSEECAAAMKHLLQCSLCTKNLHRVEELMGLMKSDSSEDAPADAISYAIDLFKSH